MKLEKATQSVFIKNWLGGHFLPLARVLEKLRVVDTYLDIQPTPPIVLVYL